MTIAFRLNEDEDELFDLARSSYTKGKGNTHGYRIMDQTPRMIWFRKGKTHIIAYRGTLDKQDVQTDVLFAKGQLHKTQDYKDRLQLTKKWLQKIPETHTVRLTGHSLGGAMAQHMLNNHYINQRVKNVLAYNPGSSLIKNQFDGDKDKITNIVRGGDIISKFKMPGKKKRVLHTPDLLVFIPGVPTLILRAVLSHKMNFK